ncbi:CTR copper uptake transporter [Hygrophoropsis aurantiaca]|uniref:CTR copper uptake transporter n=1 Tax=Hygrophoropsis aurantiaca TaxID=72124 RepID=A0ACB8ADU0_9AGAM|nr:CTR copper uptake transporter [Hygrophoropsis aurantiaca]
MFSILFLALSFVGQCIAQDNGMDMSMDGPMNLAMGNMLNYLHFTPGDNLWFLGWVPKSAGSMVGACIGIFLLALVERWIAACRAMMELHWSREASAVASAKLTGTPNLPIPASISKRMTPPFIPAYDVARGIMFAAQALLGYLFMLTAMTFSLGFISALVVGLGVGEMLFGRYSSSAHLR